MTLQEIKQSLRLNQTVSATDAELLSAVDAATEQLENRTDRVLCTQTFVWSSDSFPDRGGPISLSKSPVQSITSVDYVDQQGDAQTLDGAAYGFNKGNRQVYLTGGSWPATSKIQESAKITYVAGYGDAAAVPMILKRIILQMAGRFFFDPAAEDPNTSEFVERLVAGYVRTGYE